MFLNDQETKVDLLYYEPIAKTIVELIRETPDAPITIGVHGDWGAGKSSVLKMTDAELSSDDRVLCLWFNGWTFEGFEDAKAVVIETIVEELRRARPGVTKVSDAARKVLKRIDWLKLAKKAGGFAFTLATGIPTLDQLNGLTGLATALLSKSKELLSADDVKSFAEHAGDYLKKADESDHLSEQIHAFRKEFQELLDAADIDKLVVLVDDLDRCLPETAIATLEAIRLFLFVPRTAFVIGADELMIEYAVREHFPDLPPSAGTVPYARNYLEKLIQVPFRIPALGLAETRVYITLVLAEAVIGSEDERFAKLLAAGREALRRPWLGRGLDHTALAKAIGTNAPAELDQSVTISDQVSGILYAGTRGNPRQIKRFLNSMMLRHAIAKARGFGEDIQRPVLAKVMLAERFAPDFYEQLARLVAASPNGRPPILAVFEDAARKTQRHQDDAKAAAKGDRKSPAKAEQSDDTSALAQEWTNSDWARKWGEVEPALKDVDLRPYVFVTRDKRSYLGGVAAPGHLENLVEKLMGNRLSVSSLKTEIAKLTGAEPEQVFDAVASQVLQSDDLKVEPKGLAGLIGLAKGHVALQRRLLAFLRDLPVVKLGAWAATSATESFTERSVVAEFAKLQQEWSLVTDNTVLSAAARGALAMTKR